MGPCALVLLTFALLHAAARSQNCLEDPKSGAFEFSAFCRPLVDRTGVRLGEVCADTLINKKDIPGGDFLRSCIRLQFRTDEGFQLNLLRGGAHFDEPPTAQARFTSRRNIDGWKENNGITDAVTSGRLLVCPEEMSGKSECCGETIGVVAYAVVTPVDNPEAPRIRAFLSPENDDFLCTTRDSDDTTSCDVSISCPSCEVDECRQTGGACVATDAFPCRVGSSASYKQEDEFCGCCGGEDSCFEGNKCVPNTGSTLCAYPQAQIGFPPDYLCKCSCVDDNTCTDPATGNCIPVADFVCIIDQWSPLRAEDGTCTCDGLRCPEGECLRQESAPPGSCTTTGVTCDSAGILSRAFDGQRCICCNDFDTEVVCIRKTDNICILVSDFPCPDGEIPASFSNKLCTCVPQIACRQTLSSVAC